MKPCSIDAQTRCEQSNRSVSIFWRALAVLGVALLVLALSSSLAQAADRIVVASKIDTEGALLGNMIALLLRRHGFEIENKIQLGPTKIVREAIIAGQIDIYPEYTGNGAFFFHLESDPVWKDAPRGYEKIRDVDLLQNHLVWLDPALVSNAWSIALNSDLARTHNLYTFADFAKYANAAGKIKLAASAEFVESPTALPAFQAAYGFMLNDDQLLILSGGDTAATNRIAAEQISGVNAAMAYTTDGAIKTLGLVVLKDDKGAQTVYQPCAVVRKAVLDRYPQIREIIAPAFTSLTLEKLRELNARISVEGHDASEVASGYLIERGLLQ